MESLDRSLDILINIFMEKEHKKDKCHNPRPLTLRQEKLDLRCSHFSKVGKLR